KNAPRLFGCPVVSSNSHSGSSSGSNGQQHSRNLSTDSTTLSKPAQSKERLETGNVPQWKTSPRGRPKERAPPPPYVQPKTGSLNDLSDDCHDAELAYTSTSAKNDSSYTQSQSLISADLNESFGMSPTPAQESDDSFDEYQDESLPSSISRSHGEMISALFNVPQRPPPLTFRPESGNNRPLSYNKAVGAEPIPVTRPRTSRSVIVENSSSSSGSGSIKRPTILNREDIVGSEVPNR
ncbi:hypothetical protein COOONC_27042, partial [Cooperia oncophora]